MSQISLIATILNEGESIRNLLDSLQAQTVPPDEIVLVDGGSSDNTVQIIQNYTTTLPLTLLEKAGCNISEGRNIAIHAAQHDIIVATDAGVRLTDNWLENLTKPFIRDLKVQVAAGFFIGDPDPAKPFEVAMSATVLPLKQEIDPATFLPSSRSVAFRKTAWQAIGGYPEWLDYCEDLIFDLRLQKQFAPFAFAGDAVVYFKPRTSLQAFFKQYYLYARGDGKADLWRKRHIIRYVTYGIAAPVCLLLTLVVHPVFFILLLLGGAIYTRQPYQRLTAYWGTLSTWGKLQAVLWVPIIRSVGDFAKMIGYPVGVFWRWQHHPPDWRRG